MGQEQDTQDHADCGGEDHPKDRLFEGGNSSVHNVPPWSGGSAVFVFFQQLFQLGGLLVADGTGPEEGGQEVG